MIFAVIFTIVVIVLEWCEVTIPASAPLCPLASMRHPVGFQVGAALVFFGLLWTMTCQMLFALNVPRFYHVSAGRHTDETSLLYMTGNFLNVAAPLTYNFIMMSKADTTAFEQTVGAMKIVPFLGSGVHSGLPILIVIVSILSLFHLLQRAVNALPCLSREEDDDEVSLVDYGVFSDREDEQLTVRDGQRLVDAERVRRAAPAVEESSDARASATVAQVELEAQ